LSVSESASRARRRCLVEEKIGCSQTQHRVTARLRGAHHRDGGVLVRL
jgi:hypothetical protein